MAPASSGGGNESEDLESSTEMSALQKQLLQKKQGRVANKSKKVLALMEQETVIDDPSTKAKLIKHTKIQVRFDHSDHQLLSMIGSNAQRYR